MKKVLFAAGALGFVYSGAALAQTVGIGTTKGGATGQVSAGIATVVSKFAGMNMRTQPMAGTQQYIPAVNSGRLEFGVANIMQTRWAWEGQSISKGRPNKNLRMVGTLMQFRVGPLVADKGPVKTLADLKGKKVPSNFSAAPLFGEFMAAFLANANVGSKDVTLVPVSSLRQHWDALTEGKVDVVVGAVGTGYLNLMAQKLNGVRFLNLDDSPAGLAAVQKFLPSHDRDGAARCQADRCHGAGEGDAFRLYAVCQQGCEGRSGL